MILQFTVSNYRAFRKMQTLSLAASNYDKTLPENCITSNLPGLKNRKWLKGAALYGPNASGKSSVLAALFVLADLIKNSAATTDEREPIRSIEPFLLGGGESKAPTGFGIVLVVDGLRYEYRVAASRERVWHESLSAFPKGRKQVWFTRDWHPDAQKYQWGPETPEGYTGEPHKINYTLKNMLYLSRAISLDGDKQLDPVYRWFKEKFFIVDLSTRTPGLDETFTARQLHGQTALAGGILELLRKADLGVTSAQVVEKKPTSEMLAQLEQFPVEMREQLKKQIRYQINLTHQGPEGLNAPLPWISESAGTHRLFSLAGPWLDTLENGYTVCIDEVETSMHPLMVAELLKLFFSEEHNKKGAQIIFTTHNPLLLNPALIRRDQVWFTDKNESGEANLYPLTDYQPRKNESLVRGYLSGRYGAVPFIPDGLLESFQRD